MFDREKNLNDFYWQRGYGAFSVSQSNIKAVKLYINNQEAHHREINFENEIKIFLMRHDMAFDEKYLWN